MKTLNSNIQMALGHAIDLHENQKRKGTALPYSIHPVSLAMMLLELDLDEDIIVAGLLHDLIEDTEWTRDDVEAHYSPRVAELVCACTEQNRSEKWEQRKIQTIEKFQGLPMDAKWVVLADKLHNLYSMCSQHDLIGDGVWDHFSRGYDQQKWYYTALKNEFSKEKDLKTSKLYKAFDFYYKKLFKE